MLQYDVIHEVTLLSSLAQIPEMLTLNAKNTEQCLDISTTDDLVLNHHKSFSVSLMTLEPDGKVLLDPVETTVNIMEEDGKS